MLDNQGWQVHFVADAHDRNNLTLPVAARQYGALILHLSIDAAGWSISHGSTGKLVVKVATFDLAERIAERIGTDARWDFGELSGGQRRGLGGLVASAMRDCNVDFDKLPRVDPDASQLRTRYAVECDE
jgi:hypothetical protein